MIAGGISATSREGTQLRVDFVRQGDRLGHTISLLSISGERLLVLESLEAAQSDEWPASPPLQSMSIETVRPDHEVAFLLGMAGSSHWSASVEALPDKAALVFDVACRHRQPPLWLGSRYRAAAGASAVTIRAEQGSLLTGADLIAIEASPASPTGTTRWRYQIALS
jgi:hypothetical protein